MKIDLTCYNIFFFFTHNLDNRNTLISVNDVIDLIGTTHDDIDFIPSNSLLSAKWKVYKQQGLSPLWYAQIVLSY